MKITDEMVAITKEEILDGATPAEVVAAVAPLIIEECAYVAENGIGWVGKYHKQGMPISTSIAAAIRDLKGQTNGKA